MVLFEFSVIPLDKGPHVSPFVARSLDVIDRSGVDYQLHSLGTTLEGELDEVLSVFRQCLEGMAKDSDRVVCTVKLDYRKGPKGRLRGNVESVETALGKKLKTQP